MKNSNLLITASMFVFGACAQTGVINQIDEPEELIGFNAGFVDNVTKAEMTTDNIGKNNNTIGVWGWKTAGSNTTQVFDEQTVTYNSSSNQSTTTKWEYSPLKYWDRTASYQFYAVSPANFNVFSISSSDYKIEAVIPDNERVQELFKNGQTGNAEESAAIDYLVAERVTCEKGKGKQSTQERGNTDTDVEFVFHHILSKLNVKVKTTSDFANSSPTIKLKKLYVYVGNLQKKYTQKDIGSVSTSDTWQNDQKWPAFTDIPTDNSEQYIVCADVDDDNLISVSTTAKDIASYLVTPTGTNTTDELYVFVKVEYYIYYGNNTKEIFTSDITPVTGSLKAGKSDDSTNYKDYDSALPKFQQGYSYDLTVAIAPQAIYFDVLSVEGYTTGTADVTAE